MQCFFVFFCHRLKISVELQHYQHRDCKHKPFTASELRLFWCLSLWLQNTSDNNSKMR